MASLYNCCNLGDGLLNNNCGFNRGGLKAIYVANLCDIASIVGVDPKEIDTITMKTNPLTTNPYFWYNIGFAKDTASFGNEIVREANTYANQNVTFTASGISAQGLKVLEQMATSDLVFICVDYKNTAYVLGRIGGLRMSAGAYGSGSAAGDLMGGEWSFSSGESEVMNSIAVGVTIEVWNGTTTDTVTL